MANAAPLAPSPSTPDDSSFVVVNLVTPDIAFAWVFNDAGDTQSNAGIRYRVAPDPGGAWTTLANVVSTATVYYMPGETLVVGEQYEWQVITNDAAFQSSPWSESRFFTVIEEVPAATITAPAVAEQTQSPMTLAWDLPAGFTADAYHVFVWKTDVTPVEMRYDSGVVVSTAKTAQVPLYGAGESVWLQLEYRYHGVWSQWASIPITVTVGPPETPLLVLEQTPGKPEVVVSIVNPAPSDVDHLAATSNDVLRDGVPVATNLPPNAVFVDGLVGAGPVDYKAIAYAASGGQAESF